jgi:large subunit ribosomal protein L22e
VKHKFFIDYSRPASDGVFDPAAFEDYLRGRVKVDGKTGQLGEKIKITRDGEFGQGLYGSLIVDLLHVV